MGCLSAGCWRSTNQGAALDDKAERVKLSVGLRKKRDRKVEFVDRLVERQIEASSVHASSGSPQNGGNDNRSRTASSVPRREGGRAGADPRAAAWNTAVEVRSHERRDAKGPWRT